VRDVLRLKHYSIRKESCVNWIKCFMLRMFHNKSRGSATRTLALSHLSHRDQRPPTEHRLLLTDHRLLITDH
jgi:hypothetical protein